MEIKIVDNKDLIKGFIGFNRKVYTGNKYYRSTMEVVLKDILTGKAEICKSSNLTPAIVIEKGEICAACIYAIVDRMQDTLQITYFEALENKEEAVEHIINYGRSLAKKNNIKKMTAGFNLHVNYILGFLANKYEEVQSFGNAYNPPYYIDYFSKYASREISFNNYITNMDSFELPVEKKIMDRMLSRYNVRPADFKNLEKDAALYTEINNHIFSSHEFYYERRLSEDLELLKDFKLFIKEENLLFLEHNGKAVGFMLWYPDFNELIKPGQALGVKTFIKNKLFGYRIKKFKLVEMGVLPEYRGRGAILALFHKLREITRGRYEECETGWIMENNLPSKGFGIRWADKEYKQYKVFLIHV
jgi:GNAT superfamily N-acetyltransferase